MRKKLIAAVLAALILLPGIWAQAETSSNPDTNAQLEGSSQPVIPAGPGSVPAEIEPSVPQPSEPVPETSQPLPEQESSEAIPSEPEASKEESHTSPAPSKQESSKESSQAKPSSTPAEPSNELWNEGMAVTLSLACDWVKNSEQGNLYFLCMGSAGKPAVSKAVNQYITDVSLREDYDEIIDLSYDTLNVTFCGYNATNVMGKDLIKKLLSYPSFNEKDLYTVAYALLAIDSNPYEIPAGVKNDRETLKQLLLSFQNPDGGFFSYSQVEASTVVQTGLALAALAPYQQEPNIGEAVEKAVDYLVAQQQKDGSFLNNGKESTTAVSKVIVALNSLGINMDDKRFIKNGKHLVEILLDHVNVDSGFSETLDSSSDVLATENAILALTSVKKQGTPYELMIPLTNDVSHGDGNIVIEEKKPLDWISTSLYILLLALGVTLTASLVLVKLHPIKRSKFYRRRHPELEDSDSLDQDALNPEELINSYQISEEETGEEDEGSSSK